jgi:hypothetical protein
MSLVLCLEEEDAFGVWYPSISDFWRPARTQLNDGTRSTWQAPISTVCVAIVFFFFFFLWVTMVTILCIEKTGLDRAASGQVLSKVPTPQRRFICFRGREIWQCAFSTALGGGWKIHLIPFHSCKWTDENQGDDDNAQCDLHTCMQEIDKEVWWYRRIAWKHQR